MKVRAIAIDETRYYNGLPADVIAIRRCYAYDPESVTYCCEIRPSYDLRYLYTSVECSPHTSDERRYELDELYAYLPGHEDMYMHASAVDRMASVDGGEFDSMEDALEDLRGNWRVG
jgi:hypothetical protein